MEEVWKPVVGYEGVYEVSNIGRVKRLPIGKQWPYRKTHNNIRKQKITRRGYLSVNLSYNDNVKWCLVHRLVAQAFIPNPNNYPYVNHKNEVKTDNRAENLEWCTHVYNCRYGSGIQRQKESRWKNDPNKVSWRKAIETRCINNSRNARKPVMQFTKQMELIKSYNSISEAAEAVNSSASKVSACCRHKTKTHYGYIWKFKSEYEAEKENENQQLTLF